MISALLFTLLAIPLIGTFCFALLFSYLFLRRGGLGLWLLTIVPISWWIYATIQAAHENIMAGYVPILGLPKIAMTMFAIYSGWAVLTGAVSGLALWAWESTTKPSRSPE